jgi:hypothetical protein
MTIQLTVVVSIAGVAGDFLLGYKKEYKCLKRIRYKRESLIKGELIYDTYACI